MAKMKGTIFAIVMLMLISSLAACGDNPTPDYISSPLSAEESETVPVDLYTPDEAMPLPPLDHYDSIAYVGYTPVSFLVEGEQQLVGGDDDDWVTWRNHVFEIVKNAPSYDELPVIETPYETGWGFNTIASNGEWEFFPVDVRYESYTLDIQPDRPEWSAYFRSISSIPEDIPVIFTDAWVFDWNNDGTEWVFVIASNTIDHYPAKENVSPNPPPPNDAGYYCLSALFINGREPILEYIWNWKISAEPLNENTYVAYLPPIDEAELSYTVDYSLIQYNSHGNPIECPVFHSTNDMSYGENGIGVGSILVCDIDGDGMAELLYNVDVIYAPIIVYKLVDGEPTEVFRISTGG